MKKRELLQSVLQPLADNNEQIKKAGQHDNRWSAGQIEAIAERQAAGNGDQAKKGGEHHHLPDAGAEMGGGGGRQGKEGDDHDNPHHPDHQDNG